MKTSPEERAKNLVRKNRQEAFSYTEASWTNALVEELTELITKADMLDWLSEHHDTVSWDDSDFWCVWDGRKPITGSTLLSAIQNAMKEKQ